MDDEEVLLVVDIENAVREDVHIQSLGEVVTNDPGLLERVDVVRGIAQDGVIGHGVGCCTNQQPRQVITNPSHMIQDKLLTVDEAVILQDNCRGVGCVPGRGTGIGRVGSQEPGKVLQKLLL